MPAKKGTPPSNFIDRTGQRFSRLTVLSRAPSKNRVRWFCRCDCGKDTVVTGDNLKSGEVQSCGCLGLDSQAARKVPHRAALYTVWKNMIKRCFDPNNESFVRYGARNIYVCARWSHDFYAFYQDVYPTWKLELTLERIDNNGHYNRQNCRWTTWKEQTRNTRKKRIVLIDGIEGCMAEVCEKLNLSRKFLENHLYRYGATPQEAADAFRLFKVNGN